MAISAQQLTIYLYSAHRAVIFAIAQLSCYSLGFQPAVLTVALMPQCCACLLFVVVCNVNVCIVAKLCVLEQKLLLTAYRKSYVRNRLMPKEWPWALFRGRWRSCQSFCHIRHSLKPLEIEAWFQRTTNGGWPMPNRMFTWSMTMTSRDPDIIQLIKPPFLTIRVILCRL